MEITGKVSGAGMVAAGLLCLGIANDQEDRDALRLYEDPVYLSRVSATSSLTAACL